MASVASSMTGQWSGRRGGAPASPFGPNPCGRTAAQSGANRNFPSGWANPPR